MELCQQKMIFSNQSVIMIFLITVNAVFALGKDKYVTVKEENDFYDAVNNVDGGYHRGWSYIESQGKAKFCNQFRARVVNQDIKSTEYSNEEVFTVFPANGNAKWTSIKVKTIICMMKPRSQKNPFNCWIIVPFDKNIYCRLLQGYKTEEEVLQKEINPHGAEKYFLYECYKMATGLKGSVIGFFNNVRSIFTS